MNVLVQSHATRRGIDARVLFALARRVVSVTAACGSASPEAEASVLFVDNEEMRALNRDYRHIDGSTDVLGFAATEAEGFVAPLPLLGDVVVSVETARRQAGERGHSLRRELAVLLVHGTAHLLGYDHEGVGKGESNRMRELERRAMAELERLLVV